MILQTLSSVTVLNLLLCWKRPLIEDTEHEFKEYLASIGDSIVCVWLDDIVKVHVHTNDPGLAIQKGSNLWFADQYEDR